jgi:hypothetical protein
MARAEIRAKLRDLLLGERTEAAAEQAERLLDELEADRRAAVKRPAAAAVEVDDEAAKWARTLARIGRGGGAMSARIWNPGGREREPAAVRENERRTYARKSSPWL